MHTISLNKEDEARAMRIHENSIVIDAMADMVDETAFDKLTEVNKMIDAGITCWTVAIFHPWDPPIDAVKGLEAWNEFIDQNGDKIILVTKASDIERAKKEGKVGAVLGAESSNPVGEDLSLLPIFHRLGMRHLQLAYYKQNLIGEGVGARTDGGLTEFGIEVVKEMNRLGIVIDMAHCKDQTTMDAITFSKHPVIASHSNARGLVNHVRNKTDEQIKAMADKGGVIGLSAWSPFNEIREGVRPSFDDMICMVDYIVKLVGVDHVGMGPDLTYLDEDMYNYWTAQNPGLRPKGGYFERSVFTTESGYDERALWPNLTKGLVAHGYSDSDIEKILGLNFLRVYREVFGG
jgi:membrane dipeptidase